MNQFLEKLRSATASSHKALERNRYAIALMSDAVTLEDYADYLSRMYGFVSVFEETLLAHVSEFFPDIQPKTPLIATDLVQLGRNPSLVVKADRQLFMNDRSAIAALGALYVMEGSSLGGMVIQKHLSEKLSEDLSAKTSYFTVYGQQTGSNWKKFLDRLCTIAGQPGNDDLIIAGAVKTFELMNKWMAETELTSVS